MDEFPSWFPCVTAACCRRRSPFIAGRRSTWRWIWPAHPVPAFASRRVATRIWAISAVLPRRSGAVIFDIHDLDETIPAPWEWDIKRLAASFVLACRTNGLGDKLARDAVLTCVRSYRQSMAQFSTMRALDVWYARFEAKKLVADIADADIRQRTEKVLAKAKNVCVVEDVFPKLADNSGETPTIKEDPPFIYHHLERGEDEFYERIEEVLFRYRESLPDDRRVLLDRYAVKDKAIKVVGVGSVGTVCSIALLMAGEKDPLFLQVKEARPSVLEAFAGPSVYPNHGQRVVKGHRLMQSASDIFLGWTEDGTGRHFYVRQLRDMKLKFRIEEFKSAKMVIFAEWCGGTLARATRVPANRL